MVSLKNGPIIHSRQAHTPEKTSTNSREASNLLWKNSAMTWAYSSYHSTGDITMYQVSSCDLDQSMYTSQSQMSDISMENGQSDESSSVLLNMLRILQVVLTTTLTSISLMRHSENFYFHDNLLSMFQQTYAIIPAKKSIIFFEQSNIHKWFFEMNITEDQYNRLLQFITPKE